MATQIWIGLQKSQSSRVNNLKSAIHEASASFTLDSIHKNLNQYTIRPDEGPMDMDMEMDVEALKNQ
jgi:hypothetical protein